MEPRRTLLDDDHHPDYMHPGRCAVIMMDDLQETDPVTISAVVLVESARPDLRVPVQTMVGRLESDVVSLVRSVPSPGGDDLAEVLVTASDPVRRVALTERLDQLRHAHLWPSVERRRRAHDEAREIYLPVAERTDPTLFRRYRWWCGMFARRYLS